MTAAAGELFISEQAISASIADLEIELGVKPLDCGRHGAKPLVPQDDVRIPLRFVTKRAEEASAATLAFKDFVLKKWRDEAAG